MRITRFSDYAFRVLMYLALDEERRATIGEIATSYDISLNHLTKVVQVLARAGLVRTVRGKGGGLFLGRAPETIRLGEVVRLCEGDRPIVECMEGDPLRCRIAPVCKLAGLLGGAFEAFYAELDRYTLADLVRIPQAKTFKRILMIDN